MFQKDQETFMCYAEAMDLYLTGLKTLFNSSADRSLLHDSDFMQLVIFG